MDTKPVLSDTDNLESRKHQKPVISVVTKVKEKQYIAVGTCHCSL